MWRDNDNRSLQPYLRYSEAQAQLDDPRKPLPLDILTAPFGEPAEITAFLDPLFSDALEQTELNREQQFQI